MYFQLVIVTVEGNLKMGREWRAGEVICCLGCIKPGLQSVISHDLGGIVDTFSKVHYAPRDDGLH